MAFGYIGTQPTNDGKDFNGLYSITDVAQLKSENKWYGSFLIFNALVIAGGGGGGAGAFNNYNGGGGGAGGFREEAGYLEFLEFGGTIAVTVGAGGAAGSNGGAGAKGSNSSIGSLIVSTGGGGGVGRNVVGTTGGSGAGDSPFNPLTTGNEGGNSDDGTPEGYDGGNGSGAGGGGGGGASEAGTGGTTREGGDGRLSVLTGTTLAGGGAGGSGALHSGGAGGGGDSRAGSATGEGGTANTGGGGGAGGEQRNPPAGGAGGSGLVVIQYDESFGTFTTIPGGLTHTLVTANGLHTYTFTAGTGTITIQEIIMAHYAFINSDTNTVEEIIVGRDEGDSSNLPEGHSDWESAYGNERPGMICKRTSYNTLSNEHLEGGTPFRGNYAQIGGTYDADNDVFYGPKPFASWTLNSTNWQWEAPVAYPEGDALYTWDEDTTSWVEYTPQFF